jgi:hypothetical protein
VRAATIFTPVITAVLILQTAGCGTLMHPERKGQRSGDVDVGVAILDGIGLLFFIIPGVIAYAVDFSNGTIYLPPPSHRASVDPKDLRQIKFDPTASRAEIETIIEKETGHAGKLDQAGLQILELRSAEEMMARFAEARDNPPRVAADLRPHESR